MTEKAMTEDDMRNMALIFRKVLDSNPVFNHYLVDCTAKLKGNTLKINFSEPYTRGLMAQDDNMALIAKAAKDVTGRDIKIKMTSKILTHPNFGGKDGLA